MDLKVIRSYEVKKSGALRQPVIVNPNVPPVPQELLDAYASSPKLLLEEFIESFWNKTDEQRYVDIAKFDLMMQTRQRLSNMAYIIKYFKRPLERFLSEHEIAKIFLTIEALFWYHLDFFQNTMANNLNSLDHELEHFLHASALDHAIFFVDFPNNIDFLERLVNSQQNLRSTYENGIVRLENRLKESGGSLGEATLGQQMGNLYRRFQDIKTQICILKEYDRGLEERQRWQKMVFFVDHFEKNCGLILNARVELINLFNALSRAQNIQDKSIKKDQKAYGPLDISMDRRATLEETVKQMQLNAKVRYNQALFKVQYDEMKKGKPTVIKITKKQVSISIFSRHVAFLEIVFPKKKFGFGRKNLDVWSYQLMRPLIPLSEIELKLTPETDVAVNFVEFYIGSEILAFQCEDAKHRKDLHQQFRLIKQEACPITIKKLEWRLANASRTTSSVPEMIDREKEGDFARFKGCQSSIERPEIKLCDAAMFQEADQTCDRPAIRA